MGKINLVARALLPLVHRNARLVPLVFTRRTKSTQIFTEFLQLDLLQRLQITTSVNFSAHKDNDLAM